MDAILLQILNGLDKGSAYAMIALGLTLIFGTLGVVNFAHGAVFMIGAFCAVTLQKLLNSYMVIVDPSKTDFLGNPLKVKVPFPFSRSMVPSSMVLKSLTYDSCRGCRSFSPPLRGGS